MRCTAKRNIFSPEDFSLFLDVSKKNLEELNLNGDIIFVHDPQL
jgi:hypothetical protein